MEITRYRHINIVRHTVSSQYMSFPFHKPISWKGGINVCKGFNKELGSGKVKNCPDVAEIGGHTSSGTGVDLRRNQCRRHKAIFHSPLYNADFHCVNKFIFIVLLEINHKLLT